MHAYRFRILLEENDQFFREIDVKANQTFEDFHNIIVESAGFNDKEMASFYICDSKWNKLQEICLCDMSIPEEDVDNDEDDPREKKQRIPISCMSVTKLSDAINDPHQRIIYVYDFLRMHTFYIELYKIMTAETSKKYPVVVKSVGKVHHAAAPAALADTDDDDEAAMLVDFNDLLGSTGVSSEDEMMEGFYDDSAIN